MEHALVFVNGRFAPELSSPGALPDGAVVDGLARVLRERPELAEPFLSRPSAVDERCFAALNTAFQRDGAFVSLPRGAVAGRAHPPRLRRATSGAPNRASHLRNLIASRNPPRPSWWSATWPWKTRPTSPTPSPTSTLGADAQLDHVAFERESERAFHVAHPLRAARSGTPASGPTRSRWAPRSSATRSTPCSRASGPSAS